ncbi:glutamine synthetase [Nocardia stercoris]|uniref:Glutamine synthetase n=1 Tax=Nocardia stercoris TaxID=2483361 RepID=A0A3M2L8C4_9NOCA|nr:glutamine synthetase [Nocardia stercoris]
MGAVAVTWVDNSGITRAKVVPVEKLPHTAAWGVGASPVFDAFLADDSIVSGRFAGSPSGDLRLHPDLDRLTRLGARPGWAWAPGERYDQDGAVHPQDSRNLLRRTVDRLAAAGWSVRAGFEVEWMAGSDEDRFVPVTSAPAYGMARVTACADYLRDVLAALARTGLTVEQIHPEYSPGQFEVTCAATDPVDAADSVVLIRETIRAVTTDRGLRATFAPAAEPDRVGNGGHVHLSLWRGADNLMAGGNGPCGATADGDSFAAGILRHLPALLAVGCPSTASYLRLVPSRWAGVYACWGPENREAALRWVTGADGERHRAANIELKCFDATANPYLLLTGLLTAGAAGLADRARLPAPVDGNPAALPQEELRRRGIRRLPGSLAEAVTAFAADPVVAGAYGPELADTLVTVRRAEIESFAGAAPAEVVARTRWLY